MMLDMESSQRIRERNLTDIDLVLKIRCISYESIVKIVVLKSKNDWGLSISLIIVSVA